MDVTELLKFSVKNKASDLHLSAGLPPMIRVDGDIRRINVPPLDHKEVHSLIYDIMNDKQRRDYEEFFETDFSFEIVTLLRGGRCCATRLLVAVNRRGYFSVRLQIFDEDNLISIDAHFVGWTVDFIAKLHELG